MIHDKIDIEKSFKNYIEYIDTFLPVSKYVVFDKKEEVNISEQKVKF